MKTKKIGIFSRIKMKLFRSKQEAAINPFDLLFESIDAPLPSRHSYGSFGDYYVNGKIGIKLFRDEDITIPDIRLEILNEFNNLKRVHDRCPDLFPKPFALVKVFYKSEKKMRYGYSMEHVDMPTLYNSTLLECDLSCKSEFVALIQVTLNDMGIHHVDLHTCNILYCKNTGNFKVIDADPRYLKIGA